MIVAASTSNVPQPPGVAAVATPALLVSVRNAAEARQAIAGGCGILDVKEPGRGSLGMADVAEIRAVCAVRNELAATIPVSAALGEVVDWQEQVRLVEGGQGPPICDGAPLVGIDYFKLGTARLAAERDWREWFPLARRRCEQRLNLPRAPSSTGWVAVAYADAALCGAPSAAEVLAAAGAWDCRGVLIDTFVKGSRGRGLWHWFDESALRNLASVAARQGVWLAVAGSLTLNDVPRLLGIGAAIVGIRSGACRGGQREGEIDRRAVQDFSLALSGACSPSDPETGGPAVSGGTMGSSVNVA